MPSKKRQARDTRHGLIKVGIICCLMSLQVDAFPTVLYETPQPFMVVKKCALRPSKSGSSVVLTVFLNAVVNPQPGS